MRYVGQTGNARCLIRELREWYKLQPDHFEGVRSEARPFFTMPDGKVATRQGLQADLRAAAVACGVDESNPRKERATPAGAREIGTLLCC